MARESTCIRCSCTDSMACDPPCSWIVVDRRRSVGICSNPTCHRGQSETALKRALRATGKELPTRKARRSRRG